MESGKFNERLQKWKEWVKHNKQKTLIAAGIVVASILFAGVLYAYQANSDPGPHHVMKQYLDHWEKGNYKSMYALLSEETKKKVDKKTFVQRHQSIAEGIGQKEIRFQVQPPKKDAEEETIFFKTTIESGMVGTISFQNRGRMVEDEAGWRVHWTPSMIFPQMQPGDKVLALRTSPGKRGEIFARNGEPLAVNQEKTAVGIIPSQVKQPKKTAQQLAEALQLNASLILDKIWKADSKSDEFVIIQTFPGDGEKQVEAVKDIPGVTIQDASTRIYPHKDLTAHITGYIRPITKEQLKQRKNEGYRTGDWIGQTGLEKAMEDRLRGTPGWRVAIFGADGRQKTVIKERPARDGKDIKVTIDLDTQKQLYRGIQKDKGAAVALDPQTGEVLGMASAPSYDPNRFIQGMSQAEWKRINSPSLPLYNRTTLAYSPGSTMKPITTSIGLNTNKISPQTTYNTDSGKWQKDSSWGGYYVTRVDNPGGGVDLGEALAWSDNIYFARVGLKIGGPTMIEYLKKYGFGEKMDFPIDVTPSQYSNDGKFHSEIQLADTAYGQGQLLISPLHLAAMYTVFANEGDMLKPQLIMEDGKPVQPQVWKKDVISPQTAEKVKELLNGVVTQPKGSARDLKTAGVWLGAKTGTAELKKSKDDKNQRQLGWLAWMAGKEAGRPDIVSTIMVDEVQDRGGSHYVFPAVKKMLEERYR